MSTGGGTSSRPAPGGGGRFKTRQRLIDSIERASVYKRLLPGVPDLIAQATLQPAADEGGYELRCPRDYEALIFEYASPTTWSPSRALFPVR